MNRKLAALAVAAVLGGALVMTAPASARDHGGGFAGGGFAGPHAFSGGSSFGTMGYPRAYSGTRSFSSTRMYGSTGYPRGFSSSGTRRGFAGSSTPPGWSHGMKRGWGGHNMPPGLYRHQYGR